MKSLPITIIDPQISQIVAGRLSRLRRPNAGELARIEVGDCLWVREPFRLRPRFDDMAPTVARDRGAVPMFPAGLHAGAAEALNFGRMRMARELPKALHRQHLLVSAVDREPLQDITDAEVRAEGFASRVEYGTAWNDAMALGKRRQSEWETNPTVLVITFTRVARPVPA